MYLGSLASRWRALVPGMDPMDSATPPQVGAWNPRKPFDFLVFCFLWGDSKGSKTGSQIGQIFLLK